ncbi:ABC transporter permease [Kribbella turkmenica]|uniref:ABC transporter permease n=1 Tax=Kribbella turkmenica TaxID=2530375 RepID=A0A4R4WB50_9ACTN|nr:ABC transporter permease [Kribbella turkmenica]TDD13443.1 ABC transporter permease [Kribbella turkmenica]
MITGLVTESTKFVRATVVRATTVVMVLGISLICSSMLQAVHTADPQLAAKLGPLIEPGGWAGYLTVAAQVTGAAGLLGYGVVLSWLFSREFADGTVTGLFAVPVSRPTIATAKLLVYLAWGVASAVALALALVLFGLAGGLGALPADVVPAIGRQLALTVLTAVIASPAAWAATVGRSVLAGIGCTIGILVVAQVTVVAGAGAWIPFAAPALWAISGGADVTTFQLALVVPILLISAALTLRSWHRLQLDR